MTLKYSKGGSYWSVLIAMLLLTGTCSILFNGFSWMMLYKKAAAPYLHYNLDTLHLFTNEYIARQYQKFTASSLPEQTTLPTFDLFVDEKDIESLERDLPSSAKRQFKQSHLKVDNPPFTGEAQFRYRGGLALHWLYEKKSLRLKLPPFSTYRNERQFNLVNPSTLHTITDWVSYDIARSIGLLTPDYFPARVFINNETNGLHFFLSKLDESFLRKNNRMPGSIYSGDTVFISNLFGSSLEGEKVFKTENNTSALWVDERLWQKDAARNAESTSDREDIKTFVNIINESDPLSFMRSFETLFDKEKFYLFWGLDRLVGSYHHDYFHNHRLYFDPYKGKFEPIAWDIRYWSVQVRIPVTPLMKQVVLNPILKYERDQIMYRLWQRFNVKHITDMVDKADSVIRPEFAADPYRQQPTADISTFILDKMMPLSMDEYADAINDLKQIYNIRHGLVGQSFNSVFANYTIENRTSDQVQITLNINGLNPIDFNPWSIIPEHLREDVKLFRIYEDNEQAVLIGEQNERLYPGIAVDIDDKLSRKDISVYGKETYKQSPLHYRYMIKGKGVSELISDNALTAKNAITSTPVVINKVDTLADASNTASLHPWQLLFDKQAVNKDIELSGEIIVNDDLFFSEEQTVTILADTVFKLSKDRSIFFYGKVIAEGTETSPIKFERKEAEHAWGSIVIHGKAASNSHLSHIHVKGGSVARRNLVDYPGQLNIHDVDSFQLEHCLISDNTVGDDALHVAYSHGAIRDCEFNNTAFDALDMDIVDVTVSDSRFSNIGNDAIDLMNSRSVISHVKINGTGDKCLSIGEASNVTVEQSQLTDCVLGIAVKDQSWVHVNDIRFSVEEGSAIALYRKNPRYSRGGEIEGERLYGITERDVDVGDYSTNHLKQGAYLPLTKHLNDAGAGVE